MKKLIFTILILLAFSLSYAQDFSKIYGYKFNSAENYTEKEEDVLKCANYLFSNPSDYEVKNRLIATQFILKWMEGTSDYTFEIGTEAIELTDENEDLFGLYLVAMTKVVLESKEKNLSGERVYSEAGKILADYCSDSKNKMKPSKKIKKIIKSKRG